MSASSGFTCITCRVGFIDGDTQRGHYKTDWHRYNLKRKVAELPPVTADTFQQKVLAQRAKVPYHRLQVGDVHICVHVHFINLPCLLLFNMFVYKNEKIEAFCNA